MDNQMRKALNRTRGVRWQWPGEGLLDRNCWPTEKKPRGKSQAYSGPSKKTLNKRAAKALRGRN